MFATRVVKSEAKPHTSSTDQHKQWAGLASQATREAAPNCCFDLGKIPIFPPGRTDQPQSTLGASHASVVQPKLVVGPVNDPLEREADRVADQVMVMPAQTSVAGTNPRIQPFSTSSASEALATSASARVDKTLASSGTALSPALQQDMERRFGFDFSRVRIHADSEAGGSAEDMNARAYTAGHKVVFAPGQFAPATAQGLRLLAHELTHVVQQSGGAGGAEVGERPPHAVQRQHDPDIDLARKLATKLKAGKRDDVLADIEALHDSDRDRLAVAVTRAFALEKPMADDLRRIIRFVQHKPVVGAGETFKASGGAAQKGAATKIGSGTVEVKTGVSVDSSAGSSTEAYSLSYTGDDADKMHWMQFVWREVTPEFPAKAGKPSKPMEMGLTHSGRDYRLTTDESKPDWLTDSGVRRSPFYEENTTVNRSAKEVKMADFPSTMEREIAPLFKDPSSTPKRVVSRFHASAYLIRNMDVVYRADIDLVWEFTSAKPSPPKATVKGAVADHIESEQRASLVSTDPNVDFLPGSKPDPLGEFAPLKDLFPKGSLTDAQWADPKTTDVQRFDDIVTIAHAQWIKEAAGDPSNRINQILTDKKEAKPGFNYFPKLAAAGETGYIDSKGLYHNPDVPLDPGDPLPRIAIILGGAAFKAGKASALGTLRHELRHATHYQLTIGWILKWREEGTGKSFKEWLSAQRKAKKISDIDFDLVSTGMLRDDPAGGHWDKSSTEVLAHVEGIMAGLPFLPPQPDLLLVIGGRYTAPIDQLHLLLVPFDAAIKPVQTLALQRLHDFCCQVLDSAHRAGFVAWIRFLLTPASLKAGSKAEEDTQALVAKDFKGHEGFLKQLLASVQKRC